MKTCLPVFSGPFNRRFHFIFIIVATYIRQRSSTQLYSQPTASSITSLQYTYHEGQTSAIPRTTNTLCKSAYHIAFTVSPYLLSLRPQHRRIHRVLFSDFRLSARHWFCLARRVQPLLHLEFPIPTCFFTCCTVPTSGTLSLESPFPVVVTQHHCATVRIPIMRYAPYA